MKQFTLLFLLICLTYVALAQENIATKAKIITSEKINNVDYLIDGTDTFTKECEYNHSSFTLKLHEKMIPDSLVIKFSSKEGCDNWIKSLEILTSNIDGNYTSLTKFNEKHFAKRFSYSNQKEMQYIRVNIISLEDCSENEHLCIEAIEVFK